jgi:hypothetical protein
MKPCEYKLAGSPDMVLRGAGALYEGRGRLRRLKLWIVGVLLGSTIAAIAIEQASTVVGAAGGWSAGGAHRSLLAIGQGQVVGRVSGGSLSGGLGFI